MRYWESNPSSKNKKNKRHRAEKRPVTSGGSLKDSPFLRKFYQHQAVISDGIHKFFFLLIIATLIYMFFLNDGGLVKILMLRYKTAKLENEIAKLQEDVQTLEIEIKRLRDDPFYIEKVGRERYGYIKPGDRVYKIVPRSSEGRALEE